jgi:hypothetical protein
MQNADRSLGYRKMLKRLRRVAESRTTGKSRVAYRRLRNGQIIAHDSTRAIYLELKMALRRLVPGRV